MSIQIFTYNPSKLSVCHYGRWTMGKIKDVEKKDEKSFRFASHITFKHQRKNIFYLISDKIALFIVKHWNFNLTKYNISLQILLLIFPARNNNFPQLQHTSVICYLVKQKLVTSSKHLGRGCLEKPDATVVSPRLEELCFNYTVSNVKTSKKVNKSYKTLFQMLWQYLESDF